MTETMTNGKTVKKALCDATSKLSENKSLDTPRLDAEVILSNILGCERVSLVVNREKTLSDEDIFAFEQMIDRRFKNEPVSYITGKREFMSLEFCVFEGVLIPRADTEILVEALIDIFKDRNVQILDLCTGSGAIAVSLAHYLKNAEITALDKFDVCVDCAKNNAVKNKVSDKVNVIKADVLSEFSLNKAFDCIVSNPPYIESALLSTLSSDVKDYEPEYALDGGDDGLIFYRRITDFAVNNLFSGGILAFEIGYNQGKSVQKIISDRQCFKNIRLINDLAGLNRVVIAEKR